MMRLDMKLTKILTLSSLDILDFSLISFVVLHERSNSVLEERVSNPIRGFQAAKFLG